MGKKNKNKKINKNSDDDIQKISENSKKNEEPTETKFLNGFSLVLANNSSKGDFKNISIEKFSISTEKKKLFENTDLKISFGLKYGLIAPNGKGKTTLLNHIINRIFPISQDLDMLIVEQEAEASDKSVFNMVLDANQRKRQLEKELSLIENIVETNDDYDDKLLEDMNDIRQELSSLGSEKDESKVRKILSGLGFIGSDQDKPTKHFSGGWRMRISIAKALYMEPTLLLLDEPTNHLDLNAVIWLTDYLENWKKTLLVVSHNQSFLNDICTDVLHIDQLKINHYRGNFYKFRKALEQKYKNDEKEWEKMEKKIKEMKKKGEPKKKVQEFIENSTVKRPEKDYIVNINFGEPSNLSIPILNVENVTFGYNDKVILQNIDFGMDCDSRVTIVGPNGAGKSTFINLLVGNLEPTNGYIFRNNGLRFAYYNQHFIDVLPMDKTPIEYLKSVKDISDQEARKLLGIIGLEGSAHVKPLEKLSGGQKSRVVLVSCQLMNPHILILDEPTNHLDIESINGLIDAINNFKGGVLIVSHDMELITETECVLWVCDNKQIKKFDGEYDDYRSYILDNI